MKSAGKNLLSGLLLVSSLMQVSNAHADVIYDLPNLEEGQTPPQAPAAPVAPTAPVAPSTSTRQSLQTGWTMLEKISRRTGGDLFTIELQNALPLLRLEIRIDGNRAKVLETTLITTQGQRLNVRDLTRTGVLESGSNNLSENLNLSDAIKKIEIRIESYGPEATVLFSALSDAGYSRLKATRARVANPETPETNQPSAPAQPRKPPTAARDTTLRTGDKVLSNNKYAGVIVGRAANGMLMVRDNDDGQIYQRSLSSVKKEVSTDSTGRYFRGLKVVSSGKYSGVITRVFSDDTILVRDNDDGKEYPRQRSSVGIESNCLPDGTYCAGTRVLSNNKYLGKISRVAGTSIMVQDDDDGKEYARDKSSLLLEISCNKPFCKGAKVLSNGKYLGTIVAVFQVGTYMIRDNDDGKLYARTQASIRLR